MFKNARNLSYFGSSGVPSHLMDKILEAYSRSGHLVTLPLLKLMSAESWPIQSLYIDDQVIDASWMKYLVMMKDTLRKLTFFSCDIRALNGLDGMKNLIELSFAKCTGLSGKVMKPLGKDMLYKLEKLSFIGCAPIKGSISNVNAPNLKEFNFIGTQVMDMKAFAQIEASLQANVLSDPNAV